MSEPPLRRPQASYPPPGGYGPPPGGGYGPPAGRSGPPHQGPPRQGPPPAPPQGRPFGPPQGHPQQAPFQGPPGGVRPPFAQAAPPSPPKKSSAGKIIAILVVALVVLGVGGFALWKTVGGQGSGGSSAAGPAQSAGSNDPAASAGSDGALSSCSLVSDEDVAAVLGGEDWTVLDAGSTKTRAYDSRVLAGVATSCLATTGDNGKLARIARYQGGDAAARFAKEKQEASRGGDKGPYFSKDVQAGDEAFCTTGSKTATAGSSSGVLVRRGDTLVYVSTNAAGEGADDGANCDLSLRLVEKVHAP